MSQLIFFSSTAKVIFLSDFLSTTQSKTTAIKSPTALKNFESSLTRFSPLIHIYQPLPLGIRAEARPGPRVAVTEVPGSPLPNTRPGPRPPDHHTMMIVSARAGTETSRDSGRRVGPVMSRWENIGGKDVESFD